MDSKKRIKLWLKYLRMAHDLNNDKEFRNKLAELIMEKNGKKRKKLDPDEGATVLSILRLLHLNKNFREILADMLNYALDEELKTLEDFDSSEAELATLTVVPK